MASRGAKALEEEPQIISPPIDQKNSSESFTIHSYGSRNSSDSSTIDHKINPSPDPKMVPTPARLLSRSFYRSQSQNHCQTGAKSCNKTAKMQVLCIESLI
jgi:hypothetical protein